MVARFVSRNPCQASKNQPDEYVRKKPEGSQRTEKAKGMRYREVKGYVVMMVDRLWQRMN